MLLSNSAFFIIIKPTSTKPQARKIRPDIQNYGSNGNLLCDHGVVERNRISSLQSHGKALEKEYCLPGVFCDSGDTPANLLCELNGHLMPCTSGFYGKWVEDVCAGRLGVFVYLVLCCLVGCCTWFSCCAASVGLSLCVGRNDDESQAALSWLLNSRQLASKKVKFSHTRYRALGPELIPVYRQSARR